MAEIERGREELKWKNLEAAPTLELLLLRYARNLSRGGISVIVGDDAINPIANAIFV